MLGSAAPRLAFGRQIARPLVDQPLLRQLTVALLAVAVSEMLLLRVVTRVGVHLPKDDAVRSGMHLASSLGSLAFNSASILAIALVALMLVVIIRQLEDLVVRGGFALLSAGMLWSLGASLTTSSSTADALFGLTMTLLVVLIGLVLMTRKRVAPTALLAVGLIVAAYLGYQYYALGHLAYRILDQAAVPPLSVAVLRLGEAMVVLAGGAVFWAWGLPRWRHVGRMGVAGVALVVFVVAASSYAPASTTSILALWTTGVSLYLPLPVYLASLTLYLLTIAACWRSEDGFWTGAGLVLILLAGYMPEATYYHLLLLLGVTFVSASAPPKERRGAVLPA